jgi:hypothetical protein
VLEVGAKKLRLVELFRVNGLGYDAQVEKLADVLNRWGVCRIAPDRTGVGDAICETLAKAIMDRRLRCEMEDFVFTGATKAALIDGLTMGLSRHEVIFPPHPALMK